MDGNLLALLGIAFMLILLISGANIGLSLLLVGVIGYSIIRDFNSAIVLLRNSFISSTLNSTYIVIPLFMLMGTFAWKSGVSDDMFNAAKVWFGRTKGGIAYAAVVACAAFGAICGSMQATTVTMCNVGKPIMKENKYKEELIGGTLACGGTLGTLIPPSNNFILYGVIAEVSIGSLFAAGVIPGILMATLFCATIFVWTKLDLEAAPGSCAYSMREKLKSTKGFIPMVLLFALVLGGMFSGLLSMIEAAAAGAFVAFLFMFLRRKCTWRVLRNCLLDTVVATGMTMVALSGATIFGAFLTITNMPTNLANAVAALTLPPWLIIAIIIVLFAIMGCFIDTITIIILTVPIFLPIIQALGYDPIWFGVIMCLVANLGVITPPMGVICYVASSTLDIPLGKVFKGATYYIVAFAITFVLIVMFPQLALWLPGLILG